MTNYVLVFEGARCPDGVELKKFGQLPEDRMDGIRFASKRREKYRLRLETPDDLVVTEFINIFEPDVPERTGINRNEVARAKKFLERYGYPLSQMDTHKYKEFEKSGITLDQLVEESHCYRRIWECIAAGDNNEALKSLRMMRGLRNLSVSGLVPDIVKRDGAPTLTLVIQELSGFMVMETALVLTGGCKVARCEQCGTIFQTGSGTGRRSTALYCSNRCRVAAQRARAIPDSKSAKSRQAKIHASGKRKPPAKRTK